jgi:hypothetical protein
MDCLNIHLCLKIDKLHQLCTSLIQGRAIENKREPVAKVLNVVHFMHM